MPDCPHKKKQFCPLYVASHGGDLAVLGCCWGELEKGCAVKRGEMIYRKSVKALAAHDAELVAERAAAEAFDMAREQRLRNMRLNGVR